MKKLITSLTILITLSFGCFAMQQTPQPTREQFSQLNAQVRVLSSANNELTEQNIQLREELQQAQRFIAQLKTEQTETQNLLADHEQRIQELEEIIDQDLSHLEKTIEKTERKAQHYKYQAQSKNQTRLEKETTVKSGLKLLVQQNQEQAQKIQALEIENRELKASNDRKQALLSEQMAQVDGQHTMLLSQIKVLETRLATQSSSSSGQQ